MKKHLIVFALIALSLPNLLAQTSTINYENDTSIFTNPERGWYFSYTPPCCDKMNPLDLKEPHDLLSLQELRSMLGWKEKVTLYRDIVKIQQHNTDIPQSRLEEIQTDLNTARKAGVKVIFRLCFNYGVEFGEGPNYFWLNRFLDQIGPIIRKNSDIIFTIESGMYGGSGESCCNSKFIHESNNNKWSALTTEGITLYNKLLSFLPDDRMMVLRYPRYKYQMCSWSNSDKQAITEFPSGAKPVNSSQAFNPSLPQSRLGHYWDCFAGDKYHWGTLDPWGQKEIDYSAPDSKYALMIGELSWSTDYNRTNGANEMKKYHFTAFHGCGNDTYGKHYEGMYGTDKPYVYDAWNNNGQYNLIGKYLGYRFRLIKAILPRVINPDSLFKASFEMANDGWSGIVNPRKVEIIFQNKISNDKYVLEVDGDGKGNRMWLPRDLETKNLVISKKLPPNIPLGEYDLFLNLPDPYPSIHDRPEYSIRLANKGLWDSNTGYNKLNATLKIDRITGIFLYSELNKIQIYPNPANGELFISSAPIGSEISISDMSGRVLLTEKINSNNHKIDVSNLKSGIYLAKIGDEFRKILIQ